ncbi:MAG: helix-turn-helix transcriptional regulator [Actinobacteria bacterium]|nr:helix-turn-helix transcriptional regulator [Actinomycetota bacterium]
MEEAWMSVKHAVLGLVIERPGYGYELVQRLERRIEGWRSSDTAVYPALRALRAEGMIRAREAADGHRGVVWYEATDSGREEFRAWVRAPIDLAPQRDPFWLKVALARAEDLPHLAESTRELERACRERLHELRAHPDGVEGVEADWPDVGQAWLRRTEAAQLEVQIESVREIRAEMERAIERGERLDGELRAGAR